MKINIFIWFSLGIMKQSGPLHPTLEASAYLCRRKSTFFDVVYKICAAYIIFKLQKTSQVPGEFMTMRLQTFNLSEWMHCTGAVHWKEISNFIAIPQFPHYLEATAEWCLMTNTWVVSTWSNMAHWHSTTYSAFQLMLWTDPLEVSPPAGCNNAPGIPREIQEVWQQI